MKNKKFSFLINDNSGKVHRKDGNDHCFRDAKIKVSLGLFCDIGEAEHHARHKGVQGKQYPNASPCEWCKVK